MKIIRKILRKSQNLIYKSVGIQRTIIDYYSDFRYKKKGYIFEFPGIVTKFFLPYYKKDWIQNHIYVEKNYFEHKELDFIFREWKAGKIGELIRGSTVIDIGANIGNHTLFYINECGVSRSYCFEPMDSTFEMLQKNIEINNISDKVVLFNVCVGASQGKANVSSYDLNNIGGTTFEPSSSGNVELKSIDQYVFDGKLALIKVDVEGFEYEVLKGMEKTLQSNMPILQIEIRNKNFEKVDELLKRLGYEGHLVERDYEFCNYIYGVGL